VHELARLNTRQRSDTQRPSIARHLSGGGVGRQAVVRTQKPGSSPYRRGGSLETAVGWLIEVFPPSVIRSVVLAVLLTMALSTLGPRQMRQAVWGLGLGIVIPFLLFVGFAVTPWVLMQEYRSWWDEWWPYYLAGSTVPAALTFWLYAVGQRLSWWATWDFPYPLASPAPASDGDSTGAHGRDGDATDSDGVGADGADHATAQARTATPASQRTGLRSGGLLLAFLGVVIAIGAQLVMARRYSYPEWLSQNAFLLLVSGLLIYFHGLKAISRAGQRQSVGLPRRPAQEGRALGYLLWTAGWLCYFAGLTVTLGAMVVTQHIAEDSRLIPLATSMPLLGAGIVTVARKMLLRARQHRARVLGSPEDLPAGSYVLYLRPFEDDPAGTALERHANPVAPTGAIGLALSGRTVEEQLADAFRPVGRLVAVGAPGEPRPHVGAVRMYLRKDDWHDPVRQLMLRSRMTVLTLGESQGTMWELTEAIMLLPPQRLLLIIPPMTRAEYIRIRKRLQTALTGSSPKLPACPAWLRTTSLDPWQGLIRYSSKGTPALVPFASRPALRSQFSVFAPYLREPFDALADLERETGRHCG
jgi:hypothetical protein